MTGFSHHVRFAAAMLFSAALIYGDLSLNLFADLRGKLSLVLVPFRAAAALPEKTYNIARDYLRGQDALLRENAALESELRENEVRLRSLDFFVRQNDELRAMLDLRARPPGAWLAAGLRRNFSQPLAARIFLDKGISHGVLPGMAAVDAAGVVGQVIRADIDTSVVNLITDSNQWITARVPRNKLLVILRGDGDAGLRVEYSPNGTDIVAGDMLVADGGAFPPGYPIAVIEEVTSGAVYQEARAAPLSAFWDNTVILIYQKDAGAETPSLR